jgi:2-(1,2-epoxy-1,2-dihydrophenyl)acetyl-CoA isomerase
MPRFRATTPNLPADNAGKGDMRMAQEAIRCEKSAGVATVTLSRPEVMNAYNGEMLAELLGVLDDIARDDAVRAVVLTGEGRAFCAGADVQGMGAMLQKGEAAEKDILKLLNEAVLALRRLPKPVVAAVNGVAAGGGANIVLACDIIIASEKARLAENFINIGLIPDGGGTYFMPERIGYQRAAEIFFTGRILSAQEALEMGLYNRVVPLEEVMNAAGELARGLAERAPLAIAACKAVMNREAIGRLEAFLEEEARHQRVMMVSQDAREGIMAFHEKRKPVFQGK